MRRVAIAGSALLLGATTLLASPLASRANTLAPVSRSALPAALSVVGHGWGHGRGMGQYGAYGYALAHEPYQWILAHYYGGTTTGAVSPATIVPVQLQELNGAASVTVADAKGTHTLTPASGVFTPAGGVALVNGPWPDGASPRPFHGQLQVLANPYRTINLVPIETYVQGVVPAESPASWGINGEAALQAQAVAARTYALSYLRNSPVICDTTSCQVYIGDPNDPHSRYTYDVNYTDAAQASTSGQILLWGSPAPPGQTPGTAAFTEFSSSTGGYTAGGNFPAVVDLGDATPSNPNHTWTTQLPTSVVQAGYGWAVGTVESITITQRNGLGDLGGRVVEIELIGSGGRITVTGSQFAGATGLRSDWFAITNAGGASGGTNGYWVVAADGGVYPFGSAPNYGSMVGRPLNAAVVGMAPIPSGTGYWLVAGDGGIFGFGNAPFYGSTGNIRLNQPVLGMTATPDGKGYWLVAGDGGIFPFGDARFYGSTGNIRLNQPVVGMVPTADGKGYWLVARDGGIFNFGDARFIGSLPGIGVTDTIVSVTPTADGGGYLMVSAGGTVYPFGDAPFFGDPATGVAGWSSRALGIFAHQG